MKFFRTRIALISILLILTSITWAQSDIDTSYFPKETIISILKQNNCNGLRFYPAVNSDGAVVTMLIGIDGEGNEIYSPRHNYSEYKLFSGIINNQVVLSSLPKEKATQACGAFTEKSAGFISDFSLEAVNKFLTAESAGVAMAFVSGENSNFSMQAYKENSDPAVYGSLALGDPCPSACGEKSQYLCQPEN
jgi:hypothetical protein